MIASRCGFSPTPISRGRRSAMGLSAGRRRRGHRRASRRDDARPPLRRALWRDRRFVTLAAGMALGLFAQIGLLAHLFSLLVPALGEELRRRRGGRWPRPPPLLGRTLVGWLMPVGADRRLVACASYGVQIARLARLPLRRRRRRPSPASRACSSSAPASATPPRCRRSSRRRSSRKEDVARVVPLIVAIGQATYAFAPATFGLIRTFAPHGAATSAGAAPYLFIATAMIQALAIAVFLAGRKA